MPLLVTEILSRMARTYRGAKTYTDDGRSDREIQLGGSVIATRLDFSTAFARPDKLRLHFRDLLPGKAIWEHHVLWSAGGSAHTYSSAAGKVRDHESLTAAITSLSGISAGIAHRVPRLFSLVAGFAVTELDGARLAGEERLYDESLCYRIEGTHSLLGPYALWIDLQSMMLRQVREATIVTQYLPRIDVPVDESRFRFDPAALSQV